MPSPASKPAQFPDYCRWCRNPIRVGDLIAFIPGHNLHDKHRLVHNGCAQTYLDQKEAS